MEGSSYLCHTNLLSLQSSWMMFTVSHLYTLLLTYSYVDRLTCVGKGRFLSGFPYYPFLGEGRMQDIQDHLRSIITLCQSIITLCPNFTHEFSNVLMPDFHTDPKADNVSCHFYHCDHGNNGANLENLKVQMYPQR